MVTTPPHHEVFLFVGATIEAPVIQPHPSPPCYFLDFWQRLKCTSNRIITFSIIIGGAATPRYVLGVLQGLVRTCLNPHFYHHEGDPPLFVTCIQELVMLKMQEAKALDLLVMLVMLVMLAGHAGMLKTVLMMLTA